MKLLANGCSMTHGQELVTDGYDPANTQLCYAKKIFDEYDVLNKEKVITYCGGGIAATNVAFGLTILGYNNIRVYDASLNEWSKNNNLPLTI